MSAPRKNRRQIQAEATRHDILAAARRLFAERGYVATAMADIAEEAQTAVPTIYQSIGPKRAILLALLDLMDAEAGVGPMWRRLGETRDPREILALAAGLTRRFDERCGDIIGAMKSAAPTEPDVAEALRQGERRHQEGTRRVAALLGSLGMLRPELSPERAGATIGVLTSAATYEQLTRDYGFSYDEAETWVRDALSALLLPASSRQ